MDGSEVMHRLWNRDLAAVLNFRHILKNLRYDGTIPVRFTRVIRIGCIRRQAEEDLQEAKKKMFCFDCKKHGGVEIGASLKFNYKRLYTPEDLQQFTKSANFLFSIEYIMLNKVFDLLKEYQDFQPKYYFDSTLEPLASLPKKEKS
ncbi:hypothetical protein PHYBLDRAFT_167659 [Phycomyces blakesleeanus NRRL 1555(-)]|uniref:Uncharacterized protein n=1 Tax=Phycomyces blakesleeanus (strain ATCC 8743b / DSM 1359 / FGSC 10004 / NBRC 33097 / NRRL 1555) TaxID=763407 RepID=A0A162PUV4_PHYB8|nr:hypothetical protein PHYBLDRAFT_167659 [Phycomyces blakesleeanus NRRL 1555(-)]OAD74236.1 hypothetical protein PHYBLDRAFT_167659 [Phycomyces blakesleeanus NRRL 1555(-)]|eukprot:XP_018292276.1 hypothetical protein PHYBLDRAFT_167659 [Phycomyces blakesleeanus NRRL 1555(-)]